MTLMSEPSLVITPQQKNRFDLFGYLIFPRLLADQIQALRAAFDQVFAEYAEQIMPWEHVVPSPAPDYAGDCGETSLAARTCA